MTAKLTTHKSKARSLAMQARFLKAIRAGQIAAWQDAAELLDVSHTSVFNMLRQARQDGHRIATRTGGAWEIMKAARK